MKQKKLTFSILVLLVLSVATGAYLYLFQNSDTENNINQANTLAQAETVSETNQQAPSAEDLAIKSPYITLAQYNSDPTKYADSKIVYFFHASWCPICKGIDTEITNDPTKIPADTTIIKTDFDSSTDLRKKYGVTYQYTFVQVDSSGNEVKQWSALNLDKAIAGIQ